MVHQLLDLYGVSLGGQQGFLIYESNVLQAMDFSQTEVNVVGIFAQSFDLEVLLVVLGAEILLVNLLDHLIPPWIALLIHANDSVQVLGKRVLDTLLVHIVKQPELS